MMVIGGVVIVTIVVLFLSLRIASCARRDKPAAIVPVTGESPGPAKAVATQSDTDSAIARLEEIVSRNPDSKEAESALFEEAAIYESRRDTLKAKELYQKIMEKFPNSGNITKVQESLDNLNIRILFSPLVTEDSFLYEVQKGDTLTKLARRFGTTVELIATSNGIRDNTIRIGKRLKVTKLKFSIVVDKSQNILTLKADGNVMKTYGVSTGKDFSTPTGTFTITNKIVSPTWYTTGAVIPADDPKNILGSRWLGISKPGYGIHGTTEPQSIGKQVTAGCVRLKNSDVEELYTIVPAGTEVLIID